MELTPNTPGCLREARPKNLTCSSMKKLVKNSSSTAVEAWIFGATGVVGRALVGELCARPEATSVTAFVRRPDAQLLVASDSDVRTEPRLEERVVAFER